MQVERSISGDVHRQTAETGPMPAKLPAAFRRDRRRPSNRRPGALTSRRTRMRRILIVLIALVPLAGCGESSTSVSYAVVTTATHDCARQPNASLDTSGGTFAF